MSDQRLQAVLEQYRQCYETWRQHTRFIWQIPSLAITICSALIVVAFYYFPPHLGRLYNAVVRLILFAIGTTFTLALCVAVLKHRYFSAVEEVTLTEIEKILLHLDSSCSKLIQRKTWKTDAKSINHRARSKELQDQEESYFRVLKDTYADHLGGGLSRLIFTGFPLRLQRRRAEVGLLWSIFITFCVFLILFLSHLYHLYLVLRPWLFC